MIFGLGIFVGALVGLFVSYHIKPRKYTDDEKYLIKLALDQRIKYLENNRLHRSYDKHNTAVDIKDSKKISRDFSTDLWR